MRFLAQVSRWSVHSACAAVCAYGGSVWFAPPPVDPEPDVPRPILALRCHPEQVLPHAALSRDELLWLAEYEDAH